MRMVVMALASVEILLFLGPLNFLMLLRDGRVGLGSGCYGPVHIVIMGPDGADLVDGKNLHLLQVHQVWLHHQSAVEFP